MDVRFWGTRGSMAKPGPTTLRYGGNTSCVEVRGADGTLIVLDCGTGAHGLGQALTSSGEPRCDGHLLITHTHWDHIQGFPFFAPLFASGNEWDIYAPGGLGQQLERTLAGQMEYNYFPVTLAQLGATIRYHDLVEGRFAVGDVRVTAQYLNHPALALGYRLESGGTVVVYSADHEPHAPESRAPASATASRRCIDEDLRHVEFLADADLVIHDAQYTVEEYPQKIGLGPHARRVGGRLRHRRRRQAAGAVSPRSAPRRRRRWTGSSSLSPARPRRRQPARGIRRRRGTGDRARRGRHADRAGIGPARRRRRRARDRTRSSSPTTTPRSCGS